MQLAVMSLISSTKDKEIVFAVVIGITKIPSEKYWVVFILIMYNIIRLNGNLYTTLPVNRGVMINETLRKELLFKLILFWYITFAFDGNGTWY